MLLKISRMLGTIMPQKGKAVAMFVVLAFTVAGLTAVTSLSDPPVVAQSLGNLSDPSMVAQLSGLSQHPNLAPGNASDSSVVTQSQGYDPNNCFYSNVTLDTCPIHSHFKGLSNATTDCFKIVGEAKVSTSDAQNYTKSVQSFSSSLAADNKLTEINKDIAGGSGPITDMNGVWKLMENGTMTRDNRQMVLDEVNSHLASAQPGFTQAQLDALTFCIISEANALGPTPNY